MLVRYWQPLRDIESISRQIEQVFDDLGTSATTEHPTWAPVVELKDVSDSFVLRAQLPGVNAQDVDLQITKQSVAIAGEYRNEFKTDDKKFYRSEFRYGKFQRVITLPVAIQNEQVEASYADGILTLTLPKVAEARNKVVNINLGKLHQSPTEPNETASNEHDLAEATNG